MAYLELNSSKIRILTPALMVGIQIITSDAIGPHHYGTDFNLLIHKYSHETNGNIICLNNK